MKIYSNKKIYFIKESIPDFCQIIDTESFSKNYLIDNQIEALFIRSNEKITRELLKDTNVKFIATATSGTDHIEQDIPHYSAPGSNANSVAEYVLYAISKFVNLQNIPTIELKIGIIGFGNIGKLVAYYCNKLGIKVFVNDPPLKDANYNFPDYLEYVELKGIFEMCNIITNHIPLTFSGKYPTNNLIDKKLLNLIASNSLFIHTSRGGVVNQSDLLESIKSKNFYLAIDVWENEPGFDLELANMSMLATPHIAGYSYDGKIKASIMVLQHFQNHFGIDVNFKILNNELQEENKIEIETIGNIKELETLIDKSRGFSNDNLNNDKFGKNDEETIKNYFINYRKSHPERREIIKTPSTKQILTQ